MKFSVTEHRSTTSAADIKELTQAIVNNDKHTIVRLFIDKTYDINFDYGYENSNSYPDRICHTALTTAILSENIEMITLLIELGANPHQSLSNLEVDAKSTGNSSISKMHDNKSYKTPASVLGFAINQPSNNLNQRLKIIRLLLQKGANLNYTDKKYEQNFVFTYAKTMHQDIFTMLVAHVVREKLFSQQELLQLLLEVVPDFEKFKVVLETLTEPEMYSAEILKTILIYDAAEVCSYFLQKFPGCKSEIICYINENIPTGTITPLPHAVVFFNAKKVLEKLHDEKLIDINQEFKFDKVMPYGINAEGNLYTSSEPIIAKMTVTPLSLAMILQREKCSTTLLSINEVNVNYPGVMLYAVSNQLPLFIELLSRPEIDVNTIGGPFKLTAFRCLLLDYNHNVNDKDKKLLALVLHPTFNPSHYQQYSRFVQISGQLSTIFTAQQLLHSLFNECSDELQKSTIDIYSRIVKLCPELLFNHVKDCQINPNRYGVKYIEQLIIALIEIELPIGIANEIYSNLAHLAFNVLDGDTHYVLCLALFSKFQLHYDDKRLFVSCVYHLNNLNDSLDTAPSYEDLMALDEFKKIRDRAFAKAALIMIQIKGKPQVFSHDLMSICYEVKPDNQRLIKQLANNFLAQLAEWKDEDIESYVNEVLKKCNEFGQQVQASDKQPISPPVLPTLTKLIKDVSSKQEDTECSVNTSHNNGLN